MRIAFDMMILTVGKDDGLQQPLDDTTVVNYNVTDSVGVLNEE